MEGKWIVDTNKRYKIFEDGVVISFVYKNPIVLKPNKDKRVFLTFKHGEIKKSINVNVLLNIYFPNLKESEDWKWVQDYERKYKIYKNGDIESCYKNGKTKILKPSIKKDEYFNIGLSKEKQRKNFLIHRLIAIHFIPNPENKPNIDHLDGNSLNNSIENLRWVSQQENCLNSKNVGKYKKGVIFYKGKFVSRIRINGKMKHLGYYKTEEEAHEEFKQKFLEHHGFECCLR